MIKLLTEDKIPEFTQFCDKKLTGAVIFTRFKAYGLSSSDALFWYSENEQGNINAVCSMTDSVFLVCSDGTADEEEIRLFSQTIGAVQVTYGKAEYTLKFSSSKNNYTCIDVSGENLRDIFPVVFEDEKNRDLFFSRWYTDASHKIRHSLIHGKCIYADGKCVSVALTSGETDSVAVISSVATLKNYRRQGFGEKVVLSLALSLDKEIYLMTDNEKTKNWYEKIGFEKDK